MVHLVAVNDRIENLHRQMKAAGRALDFKEAKRCRDQISLMRGGASADQAEQADLTGLDRSEPGAMGLGTSQSRLSRPENWHLPKQPAPMTYGRSTRRGRRLKQ